MFWGYSPLAAPENALRLCYIFKIVNKSSPKHIQDLKNIWKASTELLEKNWVQSFLLTYLLLLHLLIVAVGFHL